MGTIIGRDEELRRIARFLDQAKTQRVARVLRITGASGNGKTALAGAARDAAQAEGWIAPLVAAHRIQATLPLIVARRLAEETIRTLSDEAPRYTSGLEGALRETADTAAFDSAFFRLVEAVLLDRPLVLVIDDAQWADRESGALLLRAIQFYADRPLVLMLVDRSDEDSEPAFEYIDETILVREFTASAAERLARTLMPTAADEVIRAVVHHARGRAIDITTIASLSDDHAHLTADEVAASARSIVAATIARLKPALREFLQICALIGDPIELPILGAMWPQDELLALIREASGTYLVQDSTSLRFVHLTVMQSVRETLPIDIPYRKRIIAAIESLPQQSVERLERLAEQAAACGERDLELTYLHRIAEDAESESLFHVVSNALRRIIDLTPFSEQSLRYYERLSLIQNATNGGDAIIVCREALSRATRAGWKKGLGQLAAQLLFNLWHIGGRAEFWNAVRQYDELLVDSLDRGHIIGAKLYAAFAVNDSTQFESYLRELANIDENPIFDIRAHVFQGQLRARIGDASGWIEQRDRARTLVERHGAPKVMNVMINAGDALFHFHYQGCVGTNLANALSHLPPRENIRMHIEAMSLLASNSPKDAIERIEEHFERELGPFSRRIFLGISGAASVLSGNAPPPVILRAIEHEAEIGLHTLETPVLLPLLCAAAALSNDAQRANRFTEAALRLASQPFEPQIFWIPTMIVRAAQRCNRTDLLRHIADGCLPRDRYPWSVAHHDLASLEARHFLALQSENQKVAHTERAFQMLSSPFFANLARATESVIHDERPSPAGILAALSRREREVARFVSEGLTNKEIAERLVLSERTVEGHVSNIFNKLNVGARSQVAVWYVANSPSAS